MQDLLTAIAVAMVLEGVAYAAFPEAMQRLIRQALAMPPAALRGAGLAAAVLGLALVAILRFAVFPP